MNNNCDDCVKSISCKLLKAGSSLSTINIKKMEKELPLECGNFKGKNNSECYSDIDPLTLMETIK